MVANPFKPYAQYPDFLSIPFGKLDKAIKGLVLDVDGTLRADGKEFEPEILAKLKTLGKRYRIILLSNCSERKAEFVRKATGLPLIRSKKPLPRYFRKAFEHIRLPPERVIVIGDRHFNDVFGANISGARAILLTRSLGDSPFLWIARTFLDVPSRILGKL